jgi:hypothetical protein
MKLRTRFWLEVALALVTGLLAALTAALPDWIEAVFGFDPDSGSGAFEWGLTVVLAVVTLVLAVGARVDYRRMLSSDTA